MRKRTLKKVRDSSTTEQQNVEQRQYEWIGEGTLRDGAKHYNTLHINDTVYNIGDFVYISSGTEKDYVCQILTLYQNLSTNDKESQINWFFRPYDLHFLKKSIKARLPPLQDNEVLFSDTIDIVSVQSFVGHAQVERFSSDDVVKDSHQLFCRWTLLIKSNGTLMPYALSTVTTRKGNHGDSLPSTTTGHVLRKRTTPGSASLSFTTPPLLKRCQTSSEQGSHLCSAVCTPQSNSFKDSKRPIAARRMLKLDTVHKKLLEDISDNEEEGYLSSDNDTENKVNCRKSDILVDKTQRRCNEEAPLTPPKRKRGRPPKKRSTLSSSKLMKNPKTRKLNDKEHSSSLCCRESEFNKILTFIKSKLINGMGGCMYISGVPGTGKTATVRQVSQHLHDLYDSGQLPEFKFIEINGLMCKEPRKAYVTTLKQLTGQKASVNRAVDVLDEYFCSFFKKDRPSVILLADELDMLWTRKQSFLYNLFDWPSQPHSKLIVIAISNTMDLPEKIMTSRIGLTRLTFNPYTYQQLEEIVSSQMSGMKKFERDSISLASRKVAAATGDARRALDICWKAIEVAERDEKKSIGMSEVNKAVQEMFTSPMILAVKNLSLKQKLFLQSILNEFKFTGIEETTFLAVHSRLNTLLELQGYKSCSSLEAAGICNMLSSLHVIVLHRGKGTHCIRLNICQDDIVFALK